MGSSLSFRMKVAMKPLLLTLFDSKGERPSRMGWGACDNLDMRNSKKNKKRKSPVFDEDLSINR